MAQTRVKVERDEFDHWKDHPVTKWLLEGCHAEAEGIKEAWIDWAWNSDQLDHVTKTKYHTRWDILNQLGELDYENACLLAGQTEEHNDADDN